MPPAGSLQQQIDPRDAAAAPPTTAELSPALPSTNVIASATSIPAALLWQLLRSGSRVAKLQAEEALPMAVESGGWEETEAAMAVSGILSQLSLLKRWHGRSAAICGAPMQAPHVSLARVRREHASLCAPDDAPALVWLLASSSAVWPVALPFCRRWPLARHLLPTALFERLGQHVVYRFGVSGETSHVTERQQAAAGKRSGSRAAKHRQRQPGRSIK